MTDALPSTLTVRSPEDILALVPIVLGFTPERSLVLVCLPTRGRAFHARVDLPRSKVDVTTVVGLLLEPVRSHDVDRVAFALYGPDTPLIRALVRRVTTQFRSNRVEVVSVLREDEGGWCEWEGRRWGAPTPFDPTAHRFRAEAVLRGVVVHDSRDRLAALLDPEPTRVAAVADALEQCEPVPADRLADEARWADATVLAGFSARDPLSAADTARLLRAVGSVPWDAGVWMSMSRELALDQVGFWTLVVRSAPPGHVAAPAAVLALAAWLSGNGALAWCALDRCTAEDPDHQLAVFVTAMLTHAVRPDRWDGLGDETEDHAWDDDWND